MKETFWDPNKIDRMGNERRGKLNHCISILKEYKEQGYILTLRQLYYQLVSRDIIPNQTREYNILSKIVTKGRMCGVIDWDSIEDRVRVPQIPYFVSGVENAINDTIKQYRLNRQEDQDNYIEVWVEKDALSGILSRVTRRFHIRLMVNRGYSSTSAMYGAFCRFRNAMDNEGQDVKVLYLGDHDPSGLDMVNDIVSRLNDFGIENYGDLQLNHIALTYNQIEQYNPPPNPIKFTDPRAGWYSSQFGETSWELDALTPQILTNLLEDEINDRIDIDIYNDVLESEKEDIRELRGKIT